MEDSSKFQQMQDEMSRFEAEISVPGVGEGAGAGGLRPIIGAGTFGAVQQQLERAGIPPPPPPPALLRPPAGPFHPAMMMPPRLMFPGIPPPPPPPSMLIPSQVRLRPSGGAEAGMFAAGLGLPPPLRALPGPAALPPPPLHKPQPVVLSAAPKLYKQTKLREPEKEKKKKWEAALPPPPAKPEPTPAPAPASAEAAPPPAAHAAPDTTHTGKTKKEKKNRKVIRTAGGTTWEDVTLLDWPDDDFRLFAGDLGNDVTDELLVRTFSKYGSFNRAKVVRDKRTNKSKGFGFISFKEPHDFIKAMKDMNGRYVGSRPIKLRKSTWKNRALDVVRKKEKEKAALLALLTSGNKS